jgi:hypothetical protein
MLFLSAFALLFLAVGGILVLFAVWSARDGDTGDMLLFAAFGATFCTAAPFAVLSTWRDRRAHRLDLERKDDFPGQPWRWYQEWASGRVASHGRARMIMFWSVAVFWNAIVGSMFFAALPEFRQGSPVLMGVVPFGAIGLLFCFWAIRATWRWVKYGASYLALGSFPGVIGGRLRARLVLPSGAPPAGDLKARLACRRVSHDDDTPEKTLWHGETTLPAQQAAATAEGLAFPIEFAVPADQPPSSPLPEMGDVVWDLDVWGEGSRMDYRARFQVPVFVTSESSDQAPPLAEARQVPLQAPDGERFEQSSRIRVSPAAAGGLDFTFPYPRQAGTTGLIALALVAFTTICVLLVSHQVPLWVPGLFGFLDLLVVWGALLYWTRSRRVHAGAEGVRVQGRKCGLRGTRFVPSQEIVEVVSEVMLEADTLMMHDLELVQKDGKRVNLGIFIPSKAEAAWLAQRMRDALEGR